MQLRQMIERVSGGLAVLLWAAAIVLVVPTHAQQSPATPNDVRKQLNRPADAAAKAPASAPQATPQTATSRAKPSPAASTASKIASKPATALGATQAKPAAPAVAQTKLAVREPARRDPFQALVKHDTNAASLPEKLPPGKAGLVIATLRIDGVVRGPSGMIVVVSNPQQRVYFLREGDRLYDGQVERVDMNGALFHQAGQDAFGKPIEREVTKLLYATPGEQR